jgi:hypothetical protein
MNVHTIHARRQLDRVRLIAESRHRPVPVWYRRAYNTCVIALIGLATWVCLVSVLSLA